ncbi:MAG: LacI family DNA-binding transcriptional regulator [Terracidiphilus sp.]
MSITVKDAARLAGVSTAKVSRITNGIDNVSGKTRDKSWLQFQNCSIVPTRTQPN